MSTERYTALNGSTKLVDFSKPAWTRVEEDTNWDGNNHVSVHGGQWGHQRLNIKRNNGGLLLIVEHWSQWQGSIPHNEEVSIETAKEWLAKNNNAGVDGYPELSVEID